MNYAFTDDDEAYEAKYMGDSPGSPEKGYKGELGEPYVVEFDGICAECGRTVHREKTFNMPGKGKAWKEWFSKQKLLCPFCFYKTKKPLEPAKPSTIDVNEVSDSKSDQYKDSLNLLNKKLELIQNVTNAILASLERDDFVAREELLVVKSRLNKAICDCGERIDGKLNL